MESNIVEAVAVTGGVGIADFSVWGLFLRSDLVIKVTMIILFVASFWSWTIIIDKWIKLRRLASDAVKFEENFWSGGSLDELYERLGSRPGDPMAAVFSAGMSEWRRSSARGLASSDSVQANLRERIERVMEVSLTREMERIERYMVFLASAGATAPFIGLFGTVWGIMNSFIGLGNAQSATLQMVAPGIAEALIATAIGLFAAIPAVIAYNRFATKVDRLSLRFESFIEEFINIVDRKG